MGVPSDVGDIYPSLGYDDAATAIDWLCRAFGFTKRLVVPGPDGRIMHSELSRDGAVIMVCSAGGASGHASPRALGGVSKVLSIHVDDPDAHYRQARDAGATITRELRDEDYGSRGYMARDPEGHVWYFGTYRPGAYWNQDGQTGSGGAG